MSDKLWAQISAASGIVFVVLLVVGAFIAPVPPATDDSADDVVSYFRENRTALLVGSYLIGAGTVFFLWFLGTLRLALVNSGASRLPIAAVGAGVAFVAVVLVGIGLGDALAFRAASDRSPDLVQALFDAQSLVFIKVSFPIGAFVLASSVVMIRWKVVSQWLGYAGLVVAAANFVAAGAVAKSGALSPTGECGFVGFLSFAAWVLVASVLMTLQAGRAQPAAA